MDVPLGGQKTNKKKLVCMFTASEVNLCEQTLIKNPLHLFFTVCTVTVQNK